MTTKSRNTTSRLKKIKITAEIPSILPIKTQNLIIKSVLDRLDGKNVILDGIDKTRADLLSNLSCAVKDHRGNSTILIGPHGSGKSTLIKQLIGSITAEHEETFQVESITLQGSIFSETQSVLKFLLNKFKLILNSPTYIEDEASSEDLSEYLAFDHLSALVKQFFSPNLLSVNKKRFIIVVLEDLEKFAAHPQQNLLYCLFELALALPVFVIGTSCRIDVLELLEKRVKSRFSQNVIYLPLPDSIENFIKRIHSNLISEFKDTNYCNSIEEFLKNSERFLSLCNFHFDLTKDVRPIFRQLSLTFSSINQGESFNWNTFPRLFDQIVGPNRQDLTLNPLILETTIVELMIIVSMCRLAGKYPQTPVTFDVMSEELAMCKLRAPGLEHFVWTRSVLQVAFDRLLNSRLLLSTTSPSSSWTDRSYMTVRLGLPIFIILDAIEKHSYKSKEIFSLACEKF